MQGHGYSRQVWILCVTHGTEEPRSMPIHAHPCERSADNAEEASLKIPLPWLWELILISALLNFLWVGSC